MRRNICIILVMGFGFMLGWVGNTVSIEPAKKAEPILVDSTAYWWELLYIGICIEETKMNAEAVNPVTKASGVIQILPLERNGYLREANQIMGYEHYANHDRFDPIKSREIFELVQNKYNPSHDLEAAVRIHLLGYAGYKANPTRKSRYVQNILSYIKIIDKSTYLRSAKNL